MLGFAGCLTEEEVVVQHVVRAQQFDRSRLERLFKDTDVVRAAFEDPTRSARGREHLRERLEGRLMYAFFYEASTRTRFSFCTAAHHLGMTVLWTEDARKFSSAAKGETLEHSIEVLCRYHPDIIVLRHNEEGASERAAGVVDRIKVPVSIINAGDGMGQHPTQALLDLYTIRQERGTIDGVTVVIGGDLKHGRTVRSLVYLLAKFDKVRICFTSPPELMPREDITEYLTRHRVQYVWMEDASSVLRDAHVVYWTRLQTERMDDRSEQARLRALQMEQYRIGPAQMAMMRSDAILMHPLPIDDEVREIAPEVESDPRAKYLTAQVPNGLYTRMALMCELLGSRIG